MNIDTYDSGLGIEEAIRLELSNLLPKRYDVMAGTVVDSRGRTGGDCDITIFNETWFPQVKAAVSKESRRVYLPIEGVYAIGEVKQSLNHKTLDDAMKKLVICHRLHRPPTLANRTVENRPGSSCRHGLSNPLYSFVIAANLSPGEDLDSLVERFFFVNKELRRLETIRALCVLNHGFVSWGFRDPVHGNMKPASFMLEDLYEPIFPIYQKVPEITSAFASLMADVSLHLFHSVLAPEGIAPTYGAGEEHFRAPDSQDIVINPDEEWLEKLKVPCDDEH